MNNPYMVESERSKTDVNKQMVRTLIGHRQMEAGLRCLSSIVRFSRDPLSLLIHDDGTLTDEDRESLAAELPGSAIVSRAEADSIVLPLLARYPKCRAYRRQHALALKLIDIPLLADEVLAYCDSDVFFLKPFTGLFAWPGQRCSAIFMQDVQDAYSLRPWHMHPIGSIRMPRSVNTGLLFLRRSEYDLDFIEWLLGRGQLEAVFNKRAHWIEQTCWAALGWRIGCRVWSGTQLIIATPTMKGVSEETVGIHFVAAYRGKLDEYSQQPVGDDSSSAVRILSSPVRPSSPLRLLVQDVIKKL